MKTIKFKKRLVFNLNDFITELQGCYLHETYDEIDDVVQKYKDFIRHSTPEVVEKSREYLMKHWIVSSDDTGTMASYIVACHKKQG